MFNRIEEITPLALQKMLYYVQGIYMVLFDEELFEEECEAWAHGPVFVDVYNVFRSFKYNPIDDTRFAMLKNRFNELTKDERMAIDLVLESFGMYSGKVLEKITHEETPWIEARSNCLPDEPSSEIISKKSIKKYFSEVAKKYEIDNVDGIMRYINSKIKSANNK